MNSIDKLIKTIKKLRSKDGCDWDRDGVPDKNHDTGYPCLWIDGTPHVLDSQNIGEYYTLFIR